MRRIKIKNKVLNLITLLSFSVIVGIDFEHVENIIPGVCMILLSLAWLTLFVYVNRGYLH